MGSEEQATARFVLPATGEAIEILPESLIEAEVIYREIFEDGIYSKHGLLVRPGDVVLDVGANIGMFCLYLAYSTACTLPTSAAQRPVTYYGFEALPPVFEVLQRNVAQLAVDGGGGKPNVVKVQALQNVALGDRVSSGVACTLFPRHPGNSTLNPEERLRMQRGIVDPYYFEGATQYMVPMRTLSDILDTEGIGCVDLLKVDVEGAELMVLKGIQDVHWSRIWQVVVEVPDVDEEVNNGDKILSVKRVLLVTQLLKKHGFQVIEEFDPNGKNYMVYAKHL
ncbi:hypothetical protein L7F22_016363 [Adiantum nelumboides]|nr:hypothetical protein [Adiantum nelumboides]